MVLNETIIGENQSITCVGAGMCLCDACCEDLAYAWNVSPGAPYTFTHVRGNWNFHRVITLIGSANCTRLFRFWLAMCATRRELHSGVCHSHVCCVIILRVFSDGDMCSVCRFFFTKKKYNRRTELTHENASVASLFWNVVSANQIGNQFRIYFLQ